MMVGMTECPLTAKTIILIIVQSLLDRDPSKPAYHSKTDPMNFSRSFGTMVFAVSGHSVMPTIINDMKNKSIRLQYSHQIKL
jgi:amino acid permease